MFISDITESEYKNGWKKYELHAFTSSNSYADTDIKNIQELKQKVEVLLQKGFPAEDIKVIIDHKFAKMPEYGITNEVVEGTRCWKGYKKKGMKTMFGKRVPNCVKNEDVTKGNFGGRTDVPQLPYEEVLDAISAWEYGDTPIELSNGYVVNAYEEGASADDNAWIVLDPQGKEYESGTGSIEDVMQDFTPKLISEGELNEVTDADAELIIKQILQSHGPEYLEQEFRKFFPMLSDQEVARFLRKHRMRNFRLIKQEDVARPNFDFEWGEAERYPFLAKLGKEGWIELANTGKTVVVNKDNVHQIGNTGADGGETFDDLDPDKVGRFKSAIARGVVEMPIIIKMPNGQLDLVAGNTRLIGLINKEGKAKVWYIDASKLNERNLNPAVADYVKGKKTKLIKVKVADLDDEAIDDRFGRVIDVDPDVGVDLDNPILLDKDGKTILDGFHRVYQAKRVGKEFIPAEIIDENFADGKKKGKSRPGRVKRAGASCKGSVSSLRAKAKKYSGERGKMYHWCANMKGGKKK